MRPSENKLFGLKTDAPPSLPLNKFLSQWNWSLCEATRFEIVCGGLLPYGREEKDEEEEGVQRVQRVPHVG